MFDFSKIRNAIIKDLQPICIHNYLILNKINILPKELIKEIIYHRLLISDEMIKLNKDIEILEQNCLYKLIDNCYSPFDHLIRGNIYQRIDILSPEYNQYLNLNINWLKISLPKACKMYSSEITGCAKKLYYIENDIFDILFKRYYQQKDGIAYIQNYKNGLLYYASNMETSYKYARLLLIRNDLI